MVSCYQPWSQETWLLISSTSLTSCVILGSPDPSLRFGSTMDITRRLNSLAQLPWVVAYSSLHVFNFRSVKYFLSILYPWILFFCVTSTSQLFIFSSHSICLAKQGVVPAQPFSRLSLTWVHRVMLCPLSLFRTESWAGTPAANRDLGTLCCQEYFPDPRETRADANAQATVLALPNCSILSQVFTFEWFYFENIFNKESKPNSNISCS